jgi:hypothetical protein
MFEKFGEFASYEEINMAAAGFKAEGDMESIKALAKENGLDPEDAKDYIAGEMDALCNAKSAALGRLQIEKAESKIDEGIKRVLFAIAENMAANNLQDAAMFITKGKRLDGIIEDMRKEASKNKTGNVGCVCGTDQELVARIRKFYGRA